MQLMRLRSLSKFALGTIYVSYALAVLSFVYILAAFVFTMVRAGDLGNTVTTALLEMPAWKQELGDGTYASPDGTVSYRLWKVYGEFAYRNMPRWNVVVAYSRLIAVWVLFLLGLRQMVALLKDLDAGRPFVRDNARRLRIVGLALVIGGFLNILYKCGVYALFRQTLVEGGTTPWMIIIEENLNPGLVIGGIVVIVISEVFRLGTMLEEEHELTI
jgi:hypothetical protein